MDGTSPLLRSETQSATMPGGIPGLLSEYGTPVAALLLLLQPILFFRSVLISRTRHIPFDIEGWHLPIASFMARCARDHVLPFWNPYSACGAPGYADIQAQAFYPVTWIALLLGNMSEGHKLFFWLQALVPLHMFLGGLFLFFAMRSWNCTVPVSLFAGTTYQLSAFFASQSQHLVAICSSAWFPLLVWCALELSRRLSGRWIGITAVATAFSVLGGFPQCTVVEVVFVVMLAIALMFTGMNSWRSVAALLGGMAIGTIACAVQLVPTLQAVDLTLAKLRWVWLPHGGGLPVQSLISFVLPNHYHIFDTSYHLPYNFTFMYVYCGHLAAVFLFVAPVLAWLRGTDPRDCKLLSITLLFVGISAIWMLGEATPIYESIYERLGSMRGALYAQFALVAFCLWVAVTAALVLQRLKLPNKELFSWAIALLAGVNLIAVSSNRQLNTAHGGYRQSQSEYAIEGNPEPIDSLHQLLQGPIPSSRIDFVSPDFWPLRAGADMYRIYSAVGDDPFNLLRYYYFRLSFSGQVFWDRIQLLKAANTPWIDGINDGYLVKGDDQPLPAEHFEQLSVPGLHLWKNKSSLPRFYLVDHVLHAANLDQARALLPQLIHPSDEAIVENLDTDWKGSGARSGSVQVISYERNRLELMVHSAAPAFLVSSEAVYPGWHATANGKPAKLYATNVAFRGMPVAAGQTQIEMSFRPDYLWQSVAASLCAVLVIGLLLAGWPGRKGWSRWPGLNR